MLERIIIDSKNTLRYGSLCESLIFYGNTVFLIDIKTLPALLQRAGYEIIEELVSNGDLTLLNMESALGGGNVEKNIYTISSFTSDKVKTDKVIESSILQVYGENHKEFDKIFDVLSKCIGTHKYNGPYLNILNNQLTDPGNIITAIEINSRGNIKTDEIKISTEQVGSAFYNIESNLPKDIIRDAVLLMTRATGEIFNSAEYNGTLSPQSDTSNYGEYKVKHLLEQNLKNEKHIKLFHETILPDHYDLRSTMESDAKHFQEFIEVWREARKFKEWVAGQPMDKLLLTEYVKSIRQISWLQKLAPRTSRFILFSGAGLLLDLVATGGAATVAGLGLNAFDEYILEHLLNKWKPDQYIEGEYKDFLALRDGN